MADGAERLAELAARNASLEAELARYRDAVEHLHQGLCVFDREGRITVVNGSYAESLRLPTGSVRSGMTGLDVIRLGMEAGHYPAGKTPEQIQADIQRQFEFEPGSAPFATSSLSSLASSSSSEPPPQAPSASAAPSAVMPMKVRMCRSMSELLIREGCPIPGPDG